MGSCPLPIPAQTAAFISAARSIVSPGFLQDAHSDEVATGTCLSSILISRILVNIGHRGLSQRVESPRHKSAGVLRLASPDVEASGPSLGLKELADDFWAAIAQRVSSVLRSGSDKNGSAWTSRGGRRMSPGSHAPDREQKRGLAAGGNTSLRDKAERGAMAQLKRSSYLKAVAWRMSRIRVFWLATKSPCRTVTWPGASPCTPIRLSPNRSKMLLRLSAQLRRP